MKKTLYSTTALAAAGLLTFGASDAFAQAAAPAAPEKLKMAIGGFFTAYAGIATNSIKDNPNAGIASNYNTFDVKNDSEINFKGSVKLDNGMKVSLQVEFETDPATAGGSTTNGNTANQVGLDESWLELDTNGYGAIRVGTQKQTILTLGVTAPTAGGLNPSNGDTSLWIVRPSSGMSIAAPYQGVSGADQNRINYLSPTVAGFRFGTGYTPSTTETDAMPVVGGPSGTQTQVTDATLQYGTTLGDFAVRASIGYSNSTSTATSSSFGLSYGGDIKYGDFTIGASWLRTRNPQDDGVNGATPTTNSANADSWNAGILYNPGPYKIGLRTMQTYSDATRATPGQDKAIGYKLGGNYVLGPGVELTGDVIHLEWRDEAAVASSENKGWAVIGGIAVTF